MTARILPYHPDQRELDAPGRFRLPSDPPGTLRFHAYQHEAITTILAQRTSAGGTGGALLGDEQGGGKTAVSAEVLSIGFAEHGWRRAVVSVLVDTIPQWVERIVAQGGPEPRVMNKRTKAGLANFEAFIAGEDGIFITGSQFLVKQDWLYRDKLTEQGATIPVIDKKTGQPTGKVERERVHLELYRKMSKRKRGGVDAMFVDEVQLFSNRKSIGRRTIGTFRGTDVTVAASGTWFGEQIENQWTIARFLWPDERIVERSFHRWRAQYMETAQVYSKEGNEVLTRDPVTGQKVPSYRTVGEQIPGQFTASLPAYLRWENPHRPPAAEVLKIEPTPEQAAQIDQLNRDMFAWLQTHEGDEAPLVIEMPMSLQTRLSQVTVAELSFADAEGTEVTMAEDAASAKLQSLRGILEHYFGGEPTLIFTHSKIGAILYAKRMARAGVRVAAWHGDMDSAERAEVKRAFIAGELDYIVATIQACGTGVDGLQLRTHNIAWVSKVPGRPALNDQALFRVFRAGITGGWDAFRHVEILIDYPGSPDVETFEALIAKQWANVQALRGGRSAAA